MAAAVKKVSQATFHKTKTSEQNFAIGEAIGHACRGHNIHKNMIYRLKKTGDLFKTVSGKGIDHQKL